MTARRQKRPPTDEERKKALGSWNDLNAYLRLLTSPEDARQLLHREQKSGNRPTFVNRIYARYNRLRALEERRRLLG